MGFYFRAQVAGHWRLDCVVLAAFILSQMHLLLPFVALSLQRTYALCYASAYETKTIETLSTDAFS